ncbi:hypothetical protein B0H12DRAFT_1231158 [Mycena haematopus]|nr:hypothetical protein B0H12DRAFT_1231158 [Mycena haematopus]
MVRCGLLHGLTTWLSRAQGHPLSLSVYGAHRKIQIRGGVEQLDISVFLPRLWRLEIDLAAGEHRPLISWNTPLPRLKRLSISLRDSDLEDVLKNAPLLTELSWKRISKGDLDFRWFASTTLTKLELKRWVNGVPAAQIIGILENFPSLSDLTCTVNLKKFPIHSPLTFPNLLYLNLDHDLGDEHSIAPIRLLDLLTLPHLVRLHCTSSLLPDVLIPFMSRSACVVCDLTCELRGDDPANIWLALKQFPYVETLDIALEANISYLLEVIDPEEKTPHWRSPRLLPKLQHLTVIYSGHAAITYPINYNHIIDILHRRREYTNMAELKSLHLMIDEYAQWDWYPDGTLEAEFRRLILTGLDFTIGVDGEETWPFD